MDLTSNSVSNLNTKDSAQIDNRVEIPNIDIMSALRNLQDTSTELHHAVGYVEEINNRLSGVASTGQKESSIEWPTSGSIADSLMEINSVLFQCIKNIREECEASFMKIGE